MSPVPAHVHCSMPGTQDSGSRQMESQHTARLVSPCFVFAEGSDAVVNRPVEAHPTAWTASGLMLRSLLTWLTSTVMPRSLNEPA